MRRFVAIGEAKQAPVGVKGSMLLVALTTVLLVVMTLGPVFAAELRAFNGQAGRVYMQNLGGGEVCLTMAEEPDFGMIETLDLKQKSHLLVSFTYHVSDLSVDEGAALHIGLDRSYEQEWSVAGTQITRTSGTVTWSFENVPAGVHEVTAGGRVEGGDLFAQLANCALSVTTALPAP